MTHQYTALLGIIITPEILLVLSNTETLTPGTYI
jgi:hypothetical protein